MTTSENNQSFSSEQMFCLRWSNHQTNLLNVFNQLRYSESFVDVTLAVDGRVLKAHKMVLSACSPYFQKMFEMTPDKHPVVFIDRVFYQDMKRLLEFMYRGEVSVHQDTLHRFLKVARSLRIRGLTDIDDPGSDGVHCSQNGDSTLWSCITESSRQHMAEQMAAAALVSCHSRLTGAAAAAAAAAGSSSTLPPRGDPASSAAVTESPQTTGRSRSTSGEMPRKIRRRRESPPGGAVDTQAPAARATLKVELPSVLAAQPAPQTTSRSLSAEHADNSNEPQDLSSTDTSDRHTDRQTDRAEMILSPTVVKQEQDVFCQPDIWISDGIFVDGQRHSSTASTAATDIRVASVTSVASTEEAEISSPDDSSSSLLDYITHDDGSVTCKLCGEQVPSRNHWYRHKYRMHAWHTYRCEPCGITYKSKRGYEAHLEAKHDQLLGNCSAASVAAAQLVERQEAEPARPRRDWEGVARVLEESRKKREEELVSDIIQRVKRECAMEGEDYTRRGYVKHF